MKGKMRKSLFGMALWVAGAAFAYADADDTPKYKDASLPVEERVEDLLRRMTLREKVLQLQNNSTSSICGRTPRGAFQP